MAGMRTSLATKLTLRTSRALWRHRARSWAEQGSHSLSKVVDAVLAEAGEVGGAAMVDLGCGSGQASLPLARRCRHVLAVDIDAEAIGLLRAQAAREGLGNVDGLISPLETLELAPASVDLVVSNYALHHLRDADKRQLVQRSFVWLRPGGRLVIGDMMLGRGLAAEDRAVMRQKVRGLIGRGPAGWWRIVKNGGRLVLRFQEKPLRSTAWESMLTAAGFVDVHARHVVSEAHVVAGTRPATSASAHGQ